MRNYSHIKDIPVLTTTRARTHVCIVWVLYNSIYINILGDRIHCHGSMDDGLCETSTALRHEPSAASDESVDTDSHRAWENIAR